MVYTKKWINNFLIIEVSTLAAVSLTISKKLTISLKHKFHDLLSTISKKLSITWYEFEQVINYTNSLTTNKTRVYT